MPDDDQEDPEIAAMMASKRANAQLGTIVVIALFVMGGIALFFATVCSRSGYTI